MPEDEKLEPLTFEHTAEFIAESLKKKLGEVDNVASVNTVKSQISDLLRKGMEKQGFIIDGPQFDVQAQRAADSPDVVKIDIRAMNAEAENYLRWLHIQNPGMFTGPPPSLRMDVIICEFVIDKEGNMEKNGNTFVPGDKVRAVSTGKTASSRGVGEVRPESSEGRVKVAWEDGTESWEKPEDLNRG